MNHEVEKSDLKTRQLLIEVNGQSAQGKADAIEKAFANLRQKVYEAVHGAVIYLRPLDVKVLEETVKTTKERFLFLFLPRERNEITLRLCVNVEVQYMEI